MKVLFSPMFSDRSKSEYEFNGEKIIATINGVTDEFDFSSFPDGEADTENIQTTLPVQPIISAKRENGELYVILLNYISLDASEDERFPEWMEVEKDG